MKRTCVASRKDNAEGKKDNAAAISTGRMPSAATLAKRAAAKRAREEEDAALRKRLAAVSAAVVSRRGEGGGGAASLADKAMDIAIASTSMQDDDGSELYSPHNTYGVN